MVNLKRTGAVVLAIAASATAGPAAAATSAERGGSPTIKVSDNEYSKSRLAVNGGTEVDFKWDSSNSNPHTVTLRSGPNGIDKGDFRSRTEVSGYNFSPKFRKPGTYELFCLIHPDDMKLKVEVRRR